MAAEGSSYPKSEQMKKAELIKEIHQLDIKIQNLGKEKSTHIYNKHGEFYLDFTQLQEIDLKMTNDRKTESVKLQQQLSTIKHKVKKFYRELQSVKPTPEFVEKLKVVMEDVESHINNFKDQQRHQYEELMKEERLTNQEIQAIDKKFEMWAMQGASSARSSARSKPVSIASNRDVTKDLPPEVAAFERFVEQSGGVRSGWDEYDHSTFMKYRIKHKGRPTFIRELIPSLPTRTEQQVIEHERWYQQYLDLNEEKKEAIQKWREKKQEEKEQVLAQAEEVSSDDEEKKKRNDQYKEIVEREKHERKLELNRWKVEKELEKAQGEEMKLRRELEKAKKTEQAKQKQLEAKKRVEQYRQVKEEERERREYEEALREQAEAEIKKQQTQDFARFQQRDMETVRSKISRARRKQEEDQEKQRRMARIKGRVEANVVRDPSRLLKPTAGWMERQADQTTSGSGPVLHIPHRAVPTWRQGLH